MVEGFLLEKGEAPLLSSTNWVSGKPEKGFFGLKLKGKDIYEIQTFRCMACGYLDSYAT
jgi:hypothetical protein